MNLSHPIEIDLLEFCKSGKFDFIKLGQSKEWILNNFLDPDDFRPELLHPKWAIWTYDRLEFHFHDNNELFLIYTDYLPELKDNSRLKIIPWIFKDASKLTLLYVLAELNKEHLNYQKLSREPKEYGVGLRLQSGVELWFANPDDALEALSPNELLLASLSLTEANRLWENARHWK